MCVAATQRAAEFDGSLRRDYNPLQHALSAADVVEHSEPDPEPCRSTQREPLDSQTTECIMVEDTPSDVELRPPHGMPASSTLMNTSVGKVEHCDIVGITFSRRDRLNSQRRMGWCCGLCQSFERRDSVHRYGLHPTHPIQRANPATTFRNNHVSHCRFVHLDRNGVLFATGKKKRCYKYQCSRLFLLDMRWPKAKRLTKISNWGTTECYASSRSTVGRPARAMAISSSGYS